MVAKALFTEISAISLLNISILCFPFAKLKIFKVAMAKVLVFIPPPVEAGDAPIHIKKIIIINVGNVNAVMSTVLKPAVLGVVAPNKAVTIFPNTECSAKVLLYSKIKKE